jgi:hypothetical protein
MKTFRSQDRLRSPSDFAFGHEDAPGKGLTASKREKSGIAFESFRFFGYSIINYPAA